MKIKVIKILFLVAAISFVLNLIWENAQAPLYSGYGAFWQHFNMCFWASLGDVVIILVLYGILALAYKNPYWFTKFTSISVMVLVSLGGAIAIIIELYALASNRWQYSGVMPIVPGLQVGLLPLLQMMLLPLITLFIVQKLIKYNKEARYE